MSKLRAWSTGCLALVLWLWQPHVASAQFERLFNTLDNTVNEMKKGNQSFSDVKDILKKLSDKLDEGVYKDQVDELISRVGQVAVVGGESFVDFARTRAIEDLQRLKQSMLGKQPPPRQPVLASTQSPKIDFLNNDRSTLTIIGWNLDVAQKDPKKFGIIIKNAKSPDRVVGRDEVTFQGQYALTLDVSKSGVKLVNFDKKVVFENFDPLFEIAIINSDPIPPERIISISGNIKTTNQDREGGFCIIELKDGERPLWSHKFPEKPEWGDWHNEVFGWDNLDLEMPANPRFIITLTQEGAEERNILWRFEARAEVRTNKGNTLIFDQNGLSLRCGDGGPATVRTTVNKIK